MAAEGNSYSISQQVYVDLQSLLQHSGEPNQEKSDENLRKTREDTLLYLRETFASKITQEEKKHLFDDYLKLVHSLNNLEGTCSDKIQFLHKIIAIYGFIELIGQEKEITSSNGEEQSTLRQSVKQLTEVLDKANARRKEVVAERDAFFKRFTNRAVQRMKSQNPLMEDLSDSRRPLKLTEEFLLLYRNEWTDAFCFLELKGMEEKNIIQHLFKILASCFNSSVKEARDMCDDIAQKVAGKTDLGLFNTALEDDVKDFMKSMAVHPFNKIPQKIYEEVVGQLRLHEDLEPYVRKCADLCWLMRIQRPPIELICVIKSDEEFKPDIHERYNFGGNKIDFMVWPVMLHHENGPVLAKGKVACKDH